MSFNFSMPSFTIDYFITLCPPIFQPSQIFLLAFTVMRQTTTDTVVPRSCATRVIRTNDKETTVVYDVSNHNETK